MSSTDALKNDILEKLTKAPLTITTEDARRMSENYKVQDQCSASIISAVETLAVAAQDLHQQTPTLGQAPKTSLLTVVNDLKAAVDADTSCVTHEVLKITQGVVSKMQRAIGQTKAPHPELEAELQAEYAKIEPKVEQGTVTKEEADHLHSLESRAHGHTEKGGLTAYAQSVVAKRERALCLGNQHSLSVKPTSAESRSVVLDKEKEAHLKPASLRLEGQQIEAN